MKYEKQITEYKERHRREGYTQEAPKDTDGRSANYNETMDAYYLYDHKDGMIEYYVKGGDGATSPDDWPSEPDHVILLATHPEEGDVIRTD